MKSLLFSKDVAEALGITREGARKLLKRLEEKHGKKVVGRLGCRRFVTAESLKHIGPGWTDKDKYRLEKLDKKCSFEHQKLKSAIMQQNQRLDKLEAAQNLSETKQNCDG